MRQERARLHAGADGAWRRPVAVAAGWEGAASVDPRLLRHRERGAFWETLARRRVTLLVTREYEHLLLALAVDRDGHPRVTHLPLPHPSGVAYDGARGVVHVACTRNPNQIYDLQPARAVVEAGRTRPRPLADRPLVPVRTRLLPGGTYLHDLALVGGRLHANAVAWNAIVRVDAAGAARAVWWPRSLDRLGAARHANNHLQLNSIAAGPTLRESYFAASVEAPIGRRPGQRNFPVDGRGVVFAGATRTPIARGLTRPHSTRLHRGRLWVDNSGYGEVGLVEDGGLRRVARLRGWTRGLAFAGDVAFVGTSRVLPRFESYAPGLDPARCECGVHALDVRTGRVLGSLIWPWGNQVFAIEPVPRAFTRGLPMGPGRSGLAAERALFYGFRTEREERRGP